MDAFVSHHESSIEDDDSASSQRAALSLSEDQLVDFEEVVVRACSTLAAACGLLKIA